ncbi:MAG: hypothetical protein Alis3KO_08600 [Aliiglaciecola sp.]
MLLSHYLPKILTALFGGLFIFAGIYTFGEPLLFDRLFVFILIFTAVICRKNVNVLGVVVILVIQRLVEETAWSVSELEYKTMIKGVFYLLSLIACWAVWYDKLAKLLVGTLILALGAEFYWILTSTKPSEIYWYVFLIANCLVVRHLIFIRVLYTEDYFPKRSQSLNLDWHIHKIFAAYAAIWSLMVVEYLVRNILGFTNALFIYSNVALLVHIISTYGVWIIFFESYKLLLPRLLKA